MLLDVAELAIDLPAADGWRRVVDRVSLSLDEGESLGVVGESGSGKTMTALAIMGLAPPARAVGSIRFEGQELSASRKRRCGNCAATGWPWSSRSR